MKSQELSTGTKLDLGWPWMA